MPRRSYARGSKAWGQDARTGERHLLRELIPDGQTRGLLVTRNSYEPRHPQEGVPDVYDPVALQNPAPNQDRPLIEILMPTVNELTLFENTRIVSTIQLGPITAEVV